MRCFGGRSKRASEQPSQTVGAVATSPVTVEVVSGGDVSGKASNNEVANLVQQARTAQIDENKNVEYRYRDKGLTLAQLEDMLPQLSGKDTALKLGGNKLTAVPKQVLAHELLRELSLPKNDLRGPLDLSRLRNLEKLYIMDNPNLGLLPRLPPSLAFLYAGNIGLAELGEETVVDLMQLRTLSLPGNKLIGLPHRMEQLTVLKELDLSKNLIWRVSIGIRSLVVNGHLESVYLQGNPLPGPLKRNLVMKHKILEFFDELVVVYETFLVLFMCWSRQRKEPSGQMELGCLPRDCLNIISSYAATNSTYESETAKRPAGERVAKPKFGHGAYGNME